jgi:7-cyano-7-deazaguanine synthase in queuosine biosynthesis
VAKSVVLLNSGGLDSAMLAAKLQRDGFEVHSLYVDTRQVNTIAAQAAAAETARRYCASHRVILVDYGVTSAFWETEAGVTLYADALDKSDVSMSIGGNHLALNASVGVAYAPYVDALEVYGAWRQEIDQSFIDRYNEINGFIENRRFRATLVTPVFALGTYEDVATFCGTTIADFAYTYSCKMGDTPCGRCARCIARAAAGL